MSNAHRAARETAALFDLTRRAKIEVAGRDAREFLNNLCTQDVKSVTAGASCEAFLTNNKARVIAHVWMIQRADNVLLLDSVAGSADKILQHLNHYLISEQAELTDRTAEFAMLRLVGPNAEKIITDLGLNPDRRHRLLALDGFDLFCPIGHVNALKQRLLDAGAALGDDAAYNVLRLEAGLPEYGLDIDDNRLVMEVNRTAQAISYTKGCYLGQETIVMARDRGQVNRLLMGIKIDPSVNACQPGAKLFRGEENIGEVASSVFSPTFGQVIALAYLRRGNWDAGTELSIDHVTKATVSPVPFLP